MISPESRDHIDVIFKFVRQRHIGHRGRVREPGFIHLQGHTHREYGLSILDGHDPPGREAAAIADPIYLIEHGLCRIARSHEISVQRMRSAVRGCETGRAQCLGKYLPPEQAELAARLIGAPIQILLNGLERQNFKQPG